ncbi:competence protein CoiA [Sedimenticola hydrogenitrophicus]|uniref:competence protein CoiA n=1 Tax=Sedimenticola hydrogenitrophicus TaxID=2967975 RepID=UPI0021A42B98|nr:competence protein CoiA [Sedimenticola hydrogenitrophicus]
MGLVAKNKHTNELVYIFDYKNPRSELKKDDLLCHLCGGELIIKAGLVRIKHFSHKPNSPCSCDYERHPESEEHLFFKRLIATQLSSEFEEYLNAKPLLEYPVHEVHRVADIVFAFPSGWLVAHEIQLSSITTEQLERRTNDYRNAGVDVIWWLGKSADTETNRQWLYKNYGECYTLDWDEVHKICTEND